MKINLTEMMRIKGRLTDINSEMDGIFRSVNAEFEDISNNLISNGLNQSIRNFQENISALAQKISQNLNALEGFVNDQMSSYSITNEEVKESLQNLVTLVNEVFDENGNVLISASAAITTNSSNRKADTTITDSSGYERGEGLQNRFATKIGNSEAKWDVVDKTYYYFKEKGLSDEQIAGIIGNMTQESALDLKCPTGQHQGLFQWERSRYPENWELETQLEHAWNEIEYDRSSGKVYADLSQQSTVDGATYSFAKYFEGYTGEMEQRQAYANAVYYYIKNNL